MNKLNLNHPKYISASLSTFYIYFIFNNQQIVYIYLQINRNNLKDCFFLSFICILKWNCNVTEPNAHTMWTKSLIIWSRCRKKQRGSQTSSLGCIGKDKVQLLCCRRAYPALCLSGSDPQSGSGESVCSIPVVKLMESGSRPTGWKGRWWVCISIPQATVLLHSTELQLLKLSMRLSDKLSCILGWRVTTEYEHDAFRKCFPNRWWAKGAFLTDDVHRLSKHWPRPFSLN